MANLEINLEEKFQYLSHAPIVEAVIDIRARPASDLVESELKYQVESLLEGYEFLDSNQEFQHEFKLEQGTQPSSQIRFDWKGLRFQSGDKKHIAQFNRDGFVFSRLEPYQDWDQFYDESIRLWNVYMQAAKPTAIDRLGLRFINRVELPFGEFQFEGYMNSPPQPPEGLDIPFIGFTHQDSFTAPSHPYVINRVVTIRPPSENKGPILIFDIDVINTTEFELDGETELTRRFLEMRWFKNKTFFGSISDKTLQLVE